MEDRASKQIVLVVDDSQDNLLHLNSLLNADYSVQTANSGGDALSAARSEVRPNLILIDTMMPGMDGYEVCRLLKSDPRTEDIPVILIAANSSVADQQRGLELGAADIIYKPIRSPIVKASVKTHLAAKKAADLLRDTNQFLEIEVAERTREVFAIQDVTIFAMASLAETRDSDTGRHIRRTQFYVKALALKLQSHHRFSAYLTEANINALFKLAPLHDIGKIGIPDKILLKPGRFDPEEFEIMKTHTLIGRDAIDRAEQELGRPVEFLKMAKEIAYSHHEKWDGSGYPEGIAGNAIPISARLMAVADVYDALTSRRIYKDGSSHDKAIQIILKDRDTHFDPDMVDALLEIQQDFVEIALKYADGDPQ